MQLLYHFHSYMEPTVQSPFRFEAEASYLIEEGDNIYVAGIIIADILKAEPCLFHVEVIILGHLL
jgi:hypothetical protein